MLKGYIVRGRLGTPVLDYANVLVKVAAILGVINRVPVTTPLHYVFVTPQLRIPQLTR